MGESKPKNMVRDGLKPRGRNTNKIIFQILLEEPHTDFGSPDSPILGRQSQDLAAPVAFEGYFFRIFTSGFAAVLDHFFGGWTRTCAKVSLWLLQ